MTLLMLAVRAWAFTIYRVDSSDLRPELLMNDRVMVNKLGCTYERGDLVVFGDTLVRIGRVEALPGDTITVAWQQYLLPGSCGCENCDGCKEQGYYLVSLGPQQVLVRRTEIIGTAHRIYPIRR